MLQSNCRVGSPKLLQKYPHASCICHSLPLSAIEMLTTYPWPFTNKQRNNTLKFLSSKVASAFRMACSSLSSTARLKLRHLFFLPNMLAIALRISLSPGIPPAGRANINQCPSVFQNRIRGDIKHMHNAKSFFCLGSHRKILKHRDCFLFVFFLQHNESWKPSAPKVPNFPSL